MHKSKPFTTFNPSKLITKHKTMKYLNEIDLTEENEPKFITYFYHKYNKFVWKVTTNGESCAKSIAEKLKINKDMKHSNKLPKYISNNL